MSHNMFYNKPEDYLYDYPFTEQRLIVSKQVISHLEYIPYLRSKDIMYMMYKVIIRTSHIG